MYTIQWFGHIHRYVQSSPSQFQNIFLTLNHLKQKLSPLVITPYPPPAQNPEQIVIYFLSLLFSRSVTPSSAISRTAACQASPSFTISWSLFPVPDISHQ